VADDNTQLDIRIGSTDPSVIGPIEAAVDQLAPTRLEQHRDVATILTVASSIVGLAKGLIELWKELKGLRQPPSVTVEAASGEQLDLNAARSEAEIHAFVAAQAGP
jgi:hypothetical protein